MRKITLFLVTVMLFSVISVFATVSANGAVLPRVVDYADVLTDAEEYMLSEKLDTLSEREQYDIVVVTSDDLDGKSDRDYADDFYDYNGYGMGENYDGVLLLISMEGNGSIYMSTCGMPYECLSSGDIDIILDYAFEYFADYDYYNTCVAFADKTVELVNENKYYYDDNSSGNTNSDNSENNVIKNALIAIVIGVIIALIVVSVMKSQLKSVKVQNEASNYVRKNSLNITGSNDIFLYKNVSRVARPQDISSGSSGRGGSHTSSSGRSHGGGGRSR